MSREFYKRRMSAGDNIVELGFNKENRSQAAFVPLEIRLRIENMLSRLSQPLPKHPDPETPLSSLNADNVNELSESLLVLSSTDINTILDVLFPRATPTFSPPGSLRGFPTPSSPPSGYSHRNQRRMLDPNLFQGGVDTFSSRIPSPKSIFSTEMNFQDSPSLHFISPSGTISPISPQESFSRNADRIRYELMEINESEDRHSLGSPTSEDWAMFSISQNGRELAIESDGERNSVAGLIGNPSIGLSMEDQNALESAIVKLIDDLEPSSYTMADDNPPHDIKESTLRRHFMDAMIRYQHQSDFVTSHYWWNAARLLRNIDGKSPTSATDHRALGPLYTAAKFSTNSDLATASRCTQKAVVLKQILRRLQCQLGTTMGTLARLRTKMWYMTDVKNSLRYEDAKNVALALKSMAGFQAMTAPELKPRSGSRSLGGSFLQKPEIQVMNVMKAPGSQGGPTKLSDEQVDITRKWLHRSGIDNFCRGEERIHRFCYEVKMSVGKLVGETMYDSPVLWSSELYQKERAMFEAPGTRPPTALSTGTSVRPSSIASDESLYPYSSQQPFSRNLDSLFRPPCDIPSLVHKSSFQSIGSRCRDGVGADTSSIGDSPGRAASTIESYQPFWSPIHTQAQSTTSISSFQSRPPSMVSDVLTTRKFERSAPRKAAFLDELKQTICGLLLSDLGSPVWSCGSETDAWFSDYLNQPRVQSQMAQRERQDRFLAELSAPSNIQANDDLFSRSGKGLRRSKSMVALSTKYKQAAKSTSFADAKEQILEQPAFEFDLAFQQLMDKFSRPANPFVKLKALNDLRGLVFAQLTATSEARNAENTAFDMPNGGQTRLQRNSVSGGPRSPYIGDDETPTPSSPAPMLNQNLSRLSVNSVPTDGQIIRALRGLIQKYQPKTLFRDLQFIAAFVPSEVLNKMDAGTAFLQFGLAAFELKDDVCHSMVEIADKIVSQELSRRQRHTAFSSTAGNGLEDAARMWIITAQEGNPVAQRELAILYLTHPELLPRVTLPLTMPRDTFKAEMMYRRNVESKSDPQSMCLALHWMQLSAAGGDELAQNRLREREEFESLA